jgi:hypothetical protein
MHAQRAVSICSRVISPQLVTGYQLPVTSYP